MSFYINPSSSEVEAALESWHWLPIHSKQPILVTAFGDIFLEGDGGIWFLDTLEGELNKVASNKDELDGVLATEDGESRFLLSGFVERAHREELTLSDGQCFSFKTAPVAGGAIEFENIEPRNFVVAVNLAGQLHSQAKGWPTGFRVSGFAVEYED